MPAFTHTFLIFPFSGSEVRFTCIHHFKLFYLTDHTFVTRYWFPVYTRSDGTDSAGNCHRLGGTLWCKQADIAFIWVIALRLFHFAVLHLVYTQTHPYHNFITLLNTLCHNVWPQDFCQVWSYGNTEPSARFDPTVTLYLLPGLILR